MHEAEPFEYNPIQRNVRARSVTQGDLEDALAPVQIILARIYDILLVIAANTGKDGEAETAIMVERHTNGGFFGPPPGFDPDYQKTLE